MIRVLKAGRFFLLAAVLALGAARAGDNTACLARDGEPQCVILISAEAEASPGERGRISTVEGAANEFRDYIKRISGADLPVRKIGLDALGDEIKKAQAEQKSALLLGRLAAKHLGLVAGEKELADPSSHVLEVTPEVIAIAGGSARGTEIGCDALLERLGVRWFFPGDLGTVIPREKTLTLKTCREAASPSFAARQFQLSNGGEWARHQRTGGIYYAGGHGIKLGPDVTVANHPDLFALVKGERRGPQLCLSNSETLRLATGQARMFFEKNPDSPWYGMGPEDKAGFCECAECRKLDGGDWDPFSSEPSMTDRYVWFFNQVLAGLKADLPGKKIAFYIYHSYMRPPVKNRPDPGIVGAIAPIALCRVHGMNNPVCPERSYLRGLVTEWKKLLPEVYERGYWFNLADPGMPFVQTSRLQDEIGFYARQGISGFRTECLGNWAIEGPSLYIAGRLMWNAAEDVDAVVRDYCGKLFGPAAQPMNEYFTLIDRRLRETDCHAGSAFNILQFYPADVRRQAGELIARAEKLAAGTPYVKRVEVFSRGFSYSMAFAAMMEAQARQDWKKAFAQLQLMDELREKLVKAYDVPMLNVGAAKSYLDRFFRLPVVQGNARTTENHGLVPLGDTWDFLLDPSVVGEAVGYERDKVTGGNWQKISAYKKTWSDLGLRYYKGLAWYRQEIEVPAKMAGQRTFLWFGGVDESARVWVNGQLAGTSPLSAFTPFELDVTGLLRAGKNAVAVCVANQRVDELGMGGITAPAFFYSPARGAEAALENVKPLRETFP